MDIKDWTILAIVSKTVLSSFSRKTGVQIAQKFSYFSLIYLLCYHERVEKWFKYSQSGEGDKNSIKFFYILNFPVSEIASCIRHWLHMSCNIKPKATEMSKWLKIIGSVFSLSESITQLWKKSSSAGPIMNVPHRVQRNKSFISCATEWERTFETRALSFRMKVGIDSRREKTNRTE